jgi:hypothetical protein
MARRLFGGGPVGPIRVITTEGRCPEPARRAISAWERRRTRRLSTTIRPSASPADVARLTATQVESEVGAWT